MKKIDQEVGFWAHMLDESKVQSWHEVYMIAHPEDEKPQIWEQLISELASDLKKHHFDLTKFQSPRYNVQEDNVQKMWKEMDFGYDWDKIKAQVYAAVISRNAAKLDNAKARYNEDELSWRDVRRNVSKKVLEECLDKICHSTEVLDANTDICYPGNTKDWPKIEKIFMKNGIAPSEMKDRKLSWTIPCAAYRKWAAYARGRMGEPWVCNSDNGPSILRKILNECPYNAGDDELVVTLNRCLDVVHARCDLASAFIEGGASTCGQVSSLPAGIVV